ncbi:hypothetical protein CANCADRAFT_17378, partial [Tortispora caseinolytica NRRL Y-17796]
MNKVRSIQKLNEQELKYLIQPSASWHADYKDSAYVAFGGLDRDLTESDILTIFSQFGSPVHVKLIRDKHTNESRGFGFLKYEDQRSTVLAVDNLCGAQILGRTLTVDHARYQDRNDGND